METDEEEKEMTTTELTQKQVTSNVATRIEAMKGHR